LERLLRDGDRTLVVRDVNGGVHFNGAFRNRHDVIAAMKSLEASGYSELVQEGRDQVLGLFEQVFDHRSYTGRSGTFFGYEGLGCIYWHMVSKLVLAVQRSIFDARDTAADDTTLRQLVTAYYDLRSGLGGSKTPEEFGAFPTDPYSHTPAHSGAKQPGLTGQVKEDILSRWGELGVRVIEGQIMFDPILLRSSEFITEPGIFEYVDIGGRRNTIDLDSGSLAFTCCQTPFIYRQSTTPTIRIVREDDSVKVIGGITVDRDTSAAIFARSGVIHRVEVELTPGF
jgi:hypothetical protein